MEQFIPFFIVLFAGVFFSSIFRRFHLPWVLALMLAGIIIGPHGIELFEINPTILFISQIGLIFLMFMAGLETKLSAFRDYKKEILKIGTLNALIPFVAGWAIGSAFGFTETGNILLGIIFMSSSIAVIVPSLETSGVIYSKVGKSIIGATILEDVASLVLLSIFLQSISQTARFPLPLFYLLVFFTLIFLRWLLPKIRWMLSVGREGRDLFEQEVRAIFVVLLGTVLAFDFLGLHPIIAGFFTGLILSDTIQSEKLIEKLRTLSYGLFIPVFFVIVGAQTNLSLLSGSDNVIALTVAIVLVSIAVKFGSGWIGAQWAGFSKDQAKLVGAATIPQLSTTLAIVFAGVELGFLKEELMTAMVVLSILTTFIAPILIRYFSKYEHRY